MAICLLLTMALGAGAREPTTPAFGLQRSVAFSESTPLASWGEVLTRLQTPLTLLNMKKNAPQLEQLWDREILDVSQQRFTVYVPAGRQEEPYALLVFLPPWEEARLPLGWAPVLDRNHTIFITPEHAGNDEHVFDRRAPLILLAAYNMTKHYRVDPQRVYVGGFSGGSRVAMRVALAYPDIFQGVLLNAGSDPIGNPDAPPPSAALFEHFQSESRLFYTTGQNDEANLGKDAGSLRSMMQWCVQNTRADVSFREGHEVANAGALQRALVDLGQAPTSSGDRADSCRARLRQELAAQIHTVEASIATGRYRDAERQLAALDARFGALATPRSLELASSLAASTAH